MRNCQILSSGDKIKLIRKKYGLRQDDIVGEEVTRNLISQIEHNKAKLTKSTAEIIIKNLNNIALENNFEINITIDYLLEDELSQASSVLDDYIEELKSLLIYKNSNFSDTLKHAEEFLIKWNIKDKKIAIYELAGDYFYMQNDLNRSVIYYEKALDLLDKILYSKVLISILRKLSVVYIYLTKYNRSLECCSFPLNHFTNMEDEYTAIFIYNSSLCYYHMHNYDKALELSNKLEKIVADNPSKLLDVLNNKACCLMESDRTKAATDVYLKTLDLIEKNNLKVSTYILVLSNLIECYVKLNIKNDVTKYSNMVLDEILDIDSDNAYVGIAYLELANGFKYLQDIKSEEKFLLKSLTFSKKHKHYSVEDKALCALADLYIELCDYEKLEDVANEAFVFSNIQEKPCNDVFYKLLKFYNEQTKKEQIDKILNFLIKFKDGIL